MRDNEKQPIFKARITQFGPERDAFGAPTTARVAPITTPDAPTAFFKIAYICRYPRFNLDIDTLVVCARFEDSTGIVLMPFEEEFTGHVPGDAYFDKGQLPNGDVHIEESLQVEKDVHAKGTVIGDTEVVASGISMSPHTHAGVHGETSGPH